jgi:hypothetical protein
MVPRRQLRVRVLEALDRRARQFRAREELWPLRVPREPVLLDDVIEQALPDDCRAFDITTLRSRAVLRLDWTDGSFWELWMIVLPSGLKLFCDSGDEESRVLASGGFHAGDESTRMFLQLLAESAGQHFGIEMSGGAPSRVRSSITDRDFLLDVFVNLFETTGAEDSVHEQLAARALRQRQAADDFRTDVESWLDLTLRGG